MDLSFHSIMVSFYSVVLRWLISIYIIAFLHVSPLQTSSLGCEIVMLAMQSLPGMELD